MKKRKVPNEVYKLTPKGLIGCILKEFGVRAEGADDRLYDALELGARRELPAAAHVALLFEGKGGRFVELVADRKGRK